MARSSFLQQKLWNCLHTCSWFFSLPKLQSPLPRTFKLSRKNKIKIPCETVYRVVRKKVRCSPKLIHDKSNLSPSLDYNSQQSFWECQWAAQNKKASEQHGGWRVCEVIMTVNETADQWRMGYEDVSSAIRGWVASALSSSDWPDPEASSWGAGHACSGDCGYPAAGSGRASVVPGTGLQTYGLW